MIKCQGCERDISYSHDGRRRYFRICMTYERMPDRPDAEFLCYASPPFYMGKESYFCGVGCVQRWVDQVKGAQAERVKAEAERRQLYEAEKRADDGRAGVA